MSLTTEKENIASDGGRWPLNILEAYARWRGPYTVENASTLLEEEPLELYNGWLVWDKLTDFIERGFAANIEQILSSVARLVHFGWAFPDQIECELKDGDVIKPDVCMVSDERASTHLRERGRDKRQVLQGGPELAVELRSPSNTRDEERRKRQKYFDNGTSIVWDVDPKRKCIWVWRAENTDQYTQFTGDDLIDCEPFLPGWRRSTADFFDKTLTAEELAKESHQQARADERQKEHQKALIERLESLSRIARKKFGSDIPSDLEIRLSSYSFEQLTNLLDEIALSTTFADWMATFPTA